jgi:hypothetical protein
MLALFTIPVLSSCGNDDEDEIPSGTYLKNYIVGSWYSYKGVVTAYGETTTVSISKTGENSASYMECDVKADGTLTFKAWQADNNGILHWVEDTGRYRINDDVVTIIDSTGESADFIYEPSSKSMITQVSVNDNGTLVHTKIYFRKK